MYSQIFQLVVDMVALCYGWHHDQEPFNHIQKEKDSSKQGNFRNPICRFMEEYIPLQITFIFMAIYCLAVVMFTIWKIYFTKEKVDSSTSNIEEIQKLSGKNESLKDLENQIEDMSEALTRAITEICQKTIMIEMQQKEELKGSEYRNTRKEEDYTPVGDIRSKAEKLPYKKNYPPIQQQMDYMESGYQMIRQKEYIPAIRMFNLALGVGTFNGDYNKNIFFWRGVALAEVGCFINAKEDFERYLMWDPYNVFARAMKSFCHLAVGDLDQAYEGFMAMVKAGVEIKKYRYLANTVKQMMDLCGNYGSPYKALGVPVAAPANQVDEAFTAAMAGKTSLDCDPLDTQENNRRIQVAYNQLKIEEFVDTYCELYHKVMKNWFSHEYMPKELFPGLNKGKSKGGSQGCGCAFVWKIFRKELVKIMKKKKKGRSGRNIEFLINQLIRI